MKQSEATNHILSFSLYTDQSLENTTHAACMHDNSYNIGEEQRDGSSAAVGEDFNTIRPENGG